jgi:SAM-dependent methyltransferase
MTEATSPTSELRNTDADWQLIGAEEPYFGVLTNPKFRRENLGDDELAEFYASGASGVTSMLARMRSLFGSFSPKSALDFGCGVGRLTRPLAELTGDAVGFDISSGMLAEARRFKGDGASFVDTFPERQFDWVVSIIVLQHITPEFGHEAIRKLLNAVGPGGGITLQITFARTVAAGGPGGRLVIDNGEVRPSVGGQDISSVPRGIMIMHDYDLGRVVSQFFASGFASLHLDKTDHGGVIGATIYARRG